MNTGLTKASQTVSRSDRSVAGLLHIKKDGQIVGANDQAKTMLQYPNNFDITDHSIFDICVSLDSDDWMGAIQEFEEQSPLQFTMVFQTYNGEFLETECMAVLEVGASVIDIFLPKIARDSEYVTEALKRLEVFEAFFDTDLLDINIKNTDQQYVATSQLFDRTFGLPRGHAVGKKPLDIFPQKFADHVTSHDKMVLDGTEVVSQIDVVPFTGKHLLVQKFPLYNKDESDAGIGVFVVDVTAIKLSEQRQIEARNKYEDYYDLSQDLLWEADENWLIRESNAAGTSSMTGIQFNIGENFIEELKKKAERPFELVEFVRSLKLDTPKTQVFDLKSGLRIKLSVKQVSLSDEIGENLVAYRGNLVVLPKVMR